MPDESSCEEGVQLLKNLKKIASLVGAGAIALSLVFTAAPAPAYAATSDEIRAQLDEVTQQLYQLYDVAEQCNYELDEAKAALQATEDRIAELEVQIPQTEADLATARSYLADIVENDYKSGTLDNLAWILGADDFDDLISRTTYVTRVSEHQQGVVDEVHALEEQLKSEKAELDEKKVEQEKQVAEKQAAQDAVNEAVAQAQAYYEGLSVELQQAIAAEEAAAQAAAQAAAAEAAAAAAARGEDSAYYGGGNSGGGSSSGGGGYSGGGYSGGSDWVARAYSVYGSGYQYSGYNYTGDAGSSSFTCSGLVDYALGYGSRTNSPSSYYNSVQNITTDPSQLNYGDLVFYGSGGNVTHVGIYVGNGTILDSCPGGGVQERSLNWPGQFIGGGSL